MQFDIQPMTIEDYQETAALWMNTPGIGLHADSDAEDKIADYLKRNPGLSFVAKSEGHIIGAVLCGHDGRRGYLNHLAVDVKYRSHGIGRALTDACLAALKSSGISKCNIMVFADNSDGYDFWCKTCWTEYPGLILMQKPTSQD